VDRVVVMKDGRIAETGTYDELMAAGNKKTRERKRGREREKGRGRKKRERKEKGSKRKRRN
jgi:ABC-type multidrug transport system ATPase subunit